MTAVDANAFMYALDFEIESIETWALTVNASITDHAEHIDETRSRATRSFQLVSESDARQVMKLVQDNDDALKASIASVGESIGSTIATAQSTLGTKIREIQGEVGTLHSHVSEAQPAAPPSADAPPGRLFSHEPEALKRKLAEHEVNPAHLHDPPVLMARLVRMETAFGALETAQRLAAQRPAHTASA